MTLKAKTILETETIPRVDLDFMNNTHFEEIDMVRELGEFITAYQENNKPSEEGRDQVTQSLEAWLQHTEAHFARENELMQETGFPALAIHSEEHKIALNKMTTMINTWKSDQDIELIADYVFSQWPVWFDGHVNSMDMITAKFAVMNGYQEN